MKLSQEPNVTASPPTQEEMDIAAAESGDSKEQGTDELNQDLSLKQVKGSDQRKIGKWFIKETLGKGGYSWVKRGVDCTTQRVYALKFMERRYEKTTDKNGKETKTLRRSQIKAVETEIEVLRRVRSSSKFIVRLFAYNLNQVYPDRDGKQREVILLVLEYAAGGELFDLLYYTDTLEPILARTYFKQLMDGVECLHSHGVIHRDLKPQNLLLDQNYNLKITDFGLSKIVNLKLVKEQAIKNAKLTNSRCGTKGYQAPEIVTMNQRMQSAAKAKQDPNKAIQGLYYTNSVDVFAMGVVLFILMTRYPPFKQASTTDKWYKYIASGDYQSFWKAHRNSGLKKSETDLITRMILFDFNKRITLDTIKKHQWYQQEVLSPKELFQVLTYRHQEMQLKRSQDDCKQSILQPSDRVTYRPLLPNFKQKIIDKGYDIKRKAPTLPDNVRPNMIRDIYTTCDAYEVLQEIKIVIEDDMRGLLINTEINEIFGNMQDVGNKPEKGEIDIDNFCLTAAIAHLKQDEDDEDDEMMSMEFEGIKIHVQLYWDSQNEATLVRFNIIDHQRNKKEDDFWQRKRTIDQWKKLKDHFVTRAGRVLTGLNTKTTEIDPAIKALYDKCFAAKKTQKN